MRFSANKVTNLKYNALVYAFKVFSWPYRKLAKRIAQMEHSSYKIEEFEVVHRYGFGDKIR